MSVLMRRENTLIIEPGSDISKIQIINFILLPNSKKHFEGPPLYVVDASDKDKLSEAKDELFKLVEMDTLVGKPLLVLGNKNDIDGALKEDQLQKMLDLEQIQNREVCIYSISAKNLTNIDNVIKWMTKYGK
ncbi:ADP-ribosylation_factor [Hexamita inflata]|uniref:ADP-ribosylation factor n=1 Tax=Hexamita inflata TaxID=28002 RepID=A0AA86QPM8_9EUKA|nr:ADP-ribosylation factor [Hexamita inflata]